MPRLTSRQSSETTVSLRLIDKDISEMSDDELQAAIDRLAGARSMVPQGGRSGGGGSAKRGPIGGSTLEDE